MVPRADETLAALVRDVELLCLDAGNTVIFLDHTRLASLVGGSDAAGGFSTTGGALIRAEGEAKHLHEQGKLFQVGWSHSSVASSRSWGQMVGTILVVAGLARERVPAVLEVAWAAHTSLNLWSLVPAGLASSLARARGAGLPVAIVSNSEGMLASLFDMLGILTSFDLVLDSGILGIEKPDPRIFQMALDHFGVAPGRALHLGDNYATDVVGARAAGIPVALIDPFAHLAGRHADVPRVPGVPAVADALAARTGRQPAGERA